MISRTPDHRRQGDLGGQADRGSRRRCEWGEYELVVERDEGHAKPPRR
ncbi:MAG: hypothetical protein U5N10_06460 [Gemmobacter sp.]|nr:hypothetical protein [Gemmobacter sp.]